MTILGSKQYKSEGAAINAARRSTLHELATACGVKQRCYLYVNEDAEIIAAQIDSDASPIDEVFDIGVFDPRGL